MNTDLLCWTCNLKPWVRSGSKWHPQYQYSLLIIRSKRKLLLSLKTLLLICAKQLLTKYWFIFLELFVTPFETIAVNWNAAQQFAILLNRWCSESYILAMFCIADVRLYEHSRKTAGVTDKIIHGSVPWRSKPVNQHAGPWHQHAWLECSPVLM